MSKMDQLRTGYDAFTLSVLTLSVAAAVVVTFDEEHNKTAQEMARKVGLGLPAAVVCMLPAVALLSLRGLVTSFGNIAPKFWCPASETNANDRTPLLPSVTTASNTTNVEQGFQRVEPSSPRTP